MKRIFFLTALLLAVCYSAALGAESPAERAEALTLVKGFLANSWPALAAWLVSETMPFLPTKANGLAHLVYTWLKSKASAGAGMVMLMLMLFGCTTVNCSLQSGERNTVRSDQDQTPTTPISTTATVPLR